MTGTGAYYNAGPALALSFVIAGIACVFAALCYAEFASILPVEGSAYAYAYGTVGEDFRVDYWMGIDTRICNGFYDGGGFLVRIFWEIAQNVWFASSLLVDFLVNFGDRSSNIFRKITARKFRNI